MDVTLIKKQEEAITKFIDAVVGAEPSIFEHSKGANDRRAARVFAREFLVRMCALSMRIGAERHAYSMGIGRRSEALPVWKDPKTGAEEVKVPIPDGEDKVVLN